MSEDLISQSVRNFLGDIERFYITDQDLEDEGLRDQQHEDLIKRLKQLDNEFHNQYQNVNLGLNLKSFMNTKSFRASVEENGLIDQFLRNTFVSDSSYLTRYERLHRYVDFDVTKKNPEKQDIPPYDFSKNFPGLNRTYTDVYANSRQFYRFDPPDGRAPLPNNQNYYTGGPPAVEEISEKENEYFLKNQLILMNVEPKYVHEKYVNALQQNVQLLGGLQDTLGVMEDNLNNNEIKSLNEKYSNYYFREHQENPEKNVRDFNPFYLHPKSEIMQKDDIREPLPINDNQYVDTPNYNQYDPVRNERPGFESVVYRQPQNQPSNGSEFRDGYLTYQSNLFAQSKQLRTMKEREIAGLRK